MFTNITLCCNIDGVIKLHRERRNMTDTIALEMAIRKKGLTKKEVAKTLGISENSFLMKINNKTEFKASEIQTLFVLLDLPNREIFFTDTV